jgi:hypothetical protein
MEQVEANILDLYGWMAVDLVLLAVEGYLSFPPRSSLFSPGSHMPHLFR